MDIVIMIQNILCICNEDTDVTENEQIVQQPNDYDQHQEGPIVYY